MHFQCHMILTCKIFEVSNLKLGRSNEHSVIQTKLYPGIYEVLIELLLQ